MSNQQIEIMKATKKATKKAGAPEKPIDWAQFEKLCALQCTQEEIGSMFGIHRETLSLRARKHYKEPDYATIYKRFGDTGKCSLRRNQFVLSKTNASMAIFLGKVWLKQKEEETNKEMLETFVQLLRTGSTDQLQAHLSQTA